VTPVTIEPLRSTHETAAMRPLLIPTLLALAATAQAQSPIVATGVKLTVASGDQGTIQAIAQDFARQGLRITLTNSTTVGDAARAQARYSVEGTRSGAFTDAQVQAIAAQCAEYAQRPGVSCTSEATRKH
jgi:hypothetical protein